MITALIDAEALVSQSAHSGLGTFVRELLVGLAGPEVTEVTIAAMTSDPTTLPPGTRAAQVQRFMRRGRPGTYEHELRRPLALLRHQHDVFHNPVPHAPRIAGPRWVQTLHDVIPLVLDDPSLRVLAHRWKRFGPRYCKANAVVAVSRHAADEGIRVLGLDHRKVHVAPNGVSRDFRPGPSRQPTERPYLLLVSEYSRRKGFAEAFAVIAALADAGYPHVLKVAGEVPPWWRDEVRELHARAGRPDRVELLGYVEDLPDLYRGAECLLITSRYEGFGLPALEAMASGTPVISFSNSALTEVVDQSGVLVEDGDVASMVAAARALLDHELMREDLVGRGLERVASFSWDQCAAVYADVYQSVAQA